jgi:hypothetical protein
MRVYGALGRDTGVGSRPIAKDPETRTNELIILTRDRDKRLWNFNYLQLRRSR